MKQVIVRLRDCRVNSIKTIRRAYYYSQAQYTSEVFNDFSDILPGQEIWIKFGNQYSAFITYEDVMKASEIDGVTFDQELWHQLADSYNVLYYLRQYLPQY